MTHYDLIICDNPACATEKRLADGARSARRVAEFAGSGLTITWGALTRHACSVDCLVAVASEMKREQVARSDDARTDLGHLLRGHGEHPHEGHEFHAQSPDD